MKTPEDKMAKTYLSKGTRTKHTYEFYKDRQDNPQWRDDFLRVRSIRRRNLAIQLLLGIIILGIIGICSLYYMTKKDTVNNVPSYSISSSSDNKTSDEKVKSKSSSDSNENAYVGPYSVPTEDINDVKTFAYNLNTRDDVSGKFSLEFNNQTGDGKIDGKNIEYQEIKTKQISVTDVNGSIRDVKVNTALVMVGETEKYVFKNSDGGVSIAVWGGSNYPHYVEAKAVENSSKADSSVSIVRNELKKGFSLVVMAYNGEDVDKAMEDNKAPTNTVHDSIETGYMKGSTMLINVRYTNGDVIKQEYSITDKVLIIGTNHIPYEINDGKVTFKTWDKKYQDGSTLTWKFTIDN